MSFIVDCYQTLLGRLPDPEGLDWLFASEADEDAIYRSFLTSPERRTIEDAVAQVRALITASGRRRNYLLLSAFGNGNLGDRAFPSIVAEHLEREADIAVFSHSVIATDNYPFRGDRVLTTAHQPNNSLVLSLFDGLLLGPGGLLAWPHWPVWEPRWAYQIPIPHAIYACGVESPLPAALKNLVRRARYASGRDDESVAALRSANGGSVLCPDPILALHRPEHRQAAAEGSRAFIMRAPLRPEHQVVADALRPGDGVICLEPHVDRVLLDLFPRMQFVTDLDMLASELARHKLVVSERYHGAIAGLMMGKVVHGWIRPDHNAAKLRELFRILGIPHLCGETLNIEAGPDFPHDQIEDRLAQQRELFLLATRQMLAALDPGRPAAGSQSAAA